MPCFTDKFRKQCFIDSIVVYLQKNMKIPVNVMWICIKQTKGTVGVHDVQNIFHEGCHLSMCVFSSTDSCSPSNFMCQDLGVAIGLKNIHIHQRIQPFIPHIPSWESSSINELLMQQLD